MTKFTKAPTIAVLINTLEGRYQQQLCQGLKDTANDLNINLIFFVGRGFNSPVEGEEHFNLIYDLAISKRLDGIITSNSLATYCGTEKYYDICQKFTYVPLVSVGVQFPDIPSVIIDNKAGMKKAVSHLIKEHNCKKIAFITGPMGQEDAKTRFDAYKEVLNHFNIPINDNLIVQGDFSYLSGRRAAITLLDERNIEFDALVSSNDEMLFAAYPEFKQRGIKIPDDVAMCGFDDIEQMKYLSPPFSTVVQPFYKQGQLALKLIRDLVKGKNVPMSNVLPTELKIRESCGCSSDPEIKNKDIFMSIKNKEIVEIFNNLDKFFGTLKENQKEKIVNFIEKIITFSRDSVCNETLFYKIFNNALNWTLDEYISVKPWHIILYFLEDYLPSPANKIKTVFHKAHMLVGEAIERQKYERIMAFDGLTWDLLNFTRVTNSALNLEKLKEKIEELVPRMSFKSYSMALYCNEDGKIQYKQNSISEYARIISLNNNGEYMLYGEESSLIKSSNLFPDDFLYNNKNKSVAIFPLINRDFQFGFIVLELCDLNPIIYEGIRAQISSVLEKIQLLEINKETMEKLQSALKRLEAFNQKLHTLSIHDEMTSLYNRRGFYLSAEKYFQKAIENKEEFLIFFIDIDGLKTINDSYGHQEGDNAIKVVAKTLKKSFRGGDIIARMGGDEFVVIARNSKKNDIGCINQRIKLYLDEYNETSQKPYQLAISSGVSIYNSSIDETSLETLINNADKKLYENKNNKKAN